MSGRFPYLYKGLSEQQIHEALNSINITGRNVPGMTEMRAVIMEAQKKNKEKGDKLYNVIWTEIKKPLSDEEREAYKQKLIDGIVEMFYEKAPSPVADGLSPIHKSGILKGYTEEQIDEAKDHLKKLLKVDEISKKMALKPIIDRIKEMKIDGYFTTYKEPHTKLRSGASGVDRAVKLFVYHYLHDVKQIEQASSKRKASPKRASPKKASPKKASPKKASPKKAKTPSPVKAKTPSPVKKAKTPSPKKKDEQCPTVNEKAKVFLLRIMRQKLKLDDLELDEYERMKPKKLKKVVMHIEQCGIDVDHIDEPTEENMENTMKELKKAVKKHLKSLESLSYIKRLASGEDVDKPKKAKSRTPSPAKKAKSRTPSPAKKAKSRTPSPAKKAKSRTPSPAKKAKGRTPSPDEEEIVLSDEEPSDMNDLDALQQELRNCLIPANKGSVRTKL